MDNNAPEVLKCKGCGKLYKSNANESKRFKCRLCGADVKEIDTSFLFKKMNIQGVME